MISEITHKSRYFLFKSQSSYVLLLILIGILSHLPWFNLSTILNNSDWGFQYVDSVKELYYSYGAWIGFSNLGYVNVQMYFNFFRVIWSVIANLGFSYDTAVKITLLIPISIFGFLSPYILIKKITGDSFIGFVLAIYYGTTTYFLLSQTAHLPISFVYALAPLIFYLFILAVENNEFANWLIFILFSFIGICYEIRIMYILAFIMLFYFCFFYLIYINRYLRVLVFSTILLSLLNLFWVLPIILGKFNASIQSITNRSIFGSWLFTLSHSFTLFDSGWTGKELENFITHPVAIYYWVIPLMTFLSLLLINNNKYRKGVLFFSVLSLVGILLTKQIDAPFTDIYLWLYNNFPGFNLFRIASKFYQITAIGYMGLLAYTLLFLKENKNKIINKYVFTGFSIIILFISLSNLQPLISGEIKTLFVTRQIPADYIILKDFILEQPEYFRTFWTPCDSRWGIFTNTKPKINNVSLIGDEWGTLLGEYDQDDKSIQNRIIDVFNLPYANTLFDMSSVKYVILPLQDTANDDNFFKYYGEKDNPNIRNWYISELEKCPWLKKVDIGTKDLIIFENENYKPYIFTLSEIYGLTSFDNLDDKYSFLTSEIKSEFAFYDLNKSKLPSRKLYVPFESIAPSNIANDKINSTIVDNNDVSNIYVNSEKKNVIISYIANKIEVSKKLRNNIYFDGTTTNLDRVPEILYTSKASSAKYYAEIGSRLIDIAAEKKEMDLGVVTEPFEIFTLSKNNAIKNASFEAGKWSADVGDCNAYDSNSILGMEISNDASEGETSVQLDATSHIACTGQNDILVDGGLDYLFGFDYQSPNAKNAGYYIQFNDTLNSVISERLSVDNANWNTFQKKIIVPEGATDMNLFIYSYSSDNKTKITTKYDNFKLFTLEKVATIDPKYEPHFEKISVPAKNEYKIEYSDPNENFNNLIKNPSLEDGLWSEQVGDCNNYDSNGQLSMSQSTEQKTNGNYSLQLGATRHIACTGAGLIPVTENRTYLFSFDYQSPNGKEAGYYLSFNDSENTIISEHLPIKDTEWHNFTKQIKAPAGASAVSLIVYAYAGDGDKETINRYDNFSFIGLPDLENRYFFVTEPKEKLNNPASVDFELINPTKKKVHIKGASTAFYLAMSESYHPQWQAQMDNQKIQGFFNKWVPWAKPDRIEDDKHFELEGFLNGWYVDTEKLCANNSACTKNPDGSYDMEMVIEFFPQRWFYLGLLISGTTLVGCLGYLGYDWRRRKRRVKSNNSSGFPPARE